MVVRKYKITFYASDDNPITQLIRRPIHDKTLLLTKIVYAADRKSVEKIAKGYVYEWLYEDSNEFSNRLEHENCQIYWEIQCIRQPRGE